MNVVVGQLNAKRATDEGEGRPDSNDARELEAVLRESRQRFIDSFSGLCDSLVLHAAGDASAPPAEDVIGLVHRLAGLGGTVGFARVSAEASALELALAASGVNADRLREGVAALQSAFAKDLREPAATGMPAAQQGAAMTVLLVEDDRVQRAVICAQLRHAGHSPIEVTCGEDAIAAARNARPDAILLDVELPGVNGYTVCRLLKADPELADIPVAFLSARGNVDDRLTGLSHGADDFLTKPIDPRELSLRLQLLNKRGQRGELPQRGVLTYEAFCVEARRALRHSRTALALIRTPPDRAVDVAAFTRDEVRQRDLCGYYDRNHVIVLLPDIGAAAARDRIGSIVENCRANDINGVYAGVAATATGGERTLEQLVEAADEALAAARYQGMAAALQPQGARPEPAEETLAALVLVGDDDPDVVRIIDAHLAAGGYRRVLTFDGSRTLEEARAQRPDVLVLDLMMPRMTGFDVLAGLREMGDARPRVIVLSARGREEDVIRSFGLGADDFMVKPFNPQELLARIARLMK